MSKITLEEAQQEFINRGYIPLFDKYNNNSEKLLAKTQEGYLIVTGLGNLKSGNKPQIFDIHNTYTIQNIKLWCKLNDKPFELLSEEYYKSNQKLKWKCLKEGCNEIFGANWDNIRSGKGCSYYAGKKVGLSNCLATKNPELSSQWHLIKNGELTPYNVTPNSNKKVWWQCENGHEWENCISNRNKDTGCPYCNGFYASKEYNLLIINPELCKEWDYSKNKKNPTEYIPNSHLKVWWICEKEHEWEDHINNRNNGSKCPYCNNKIIYLDNYLKNCLVNCLAIKNPELAKEWYPVKNGDLTPWDVTCWKNKKIWWICNECGYEWDTKISHRANGSGCPICNLNKGEKHYNWQGGISSLHDYLNRHIYIWKRVSMKNCNYKCIISEEKSDWHIHHLYPFNYIVKETLAILKLPLYSNINKYSNDELLLLENKCLELHHKYGLGVCLTKELHNEFHKIYSNNNFTPENFYEFYKIKTNKEFNLDLKYA